MKRFHSIVAITALLAGCASQPLVDRTGVDASVAPQQVAEGGAVAEGTVNWGGRVIEIRTVDESTELEILSFPLSGSGRPDTAGDSDGRFIAVREGFVDPLVYDKGRTVTVVGRLAGVREGTIGEQAYRWPVITVSDMAPVSESSRGGGATPFFSIGVGFGF